MGRSGKLQWVMIRGPSPRRSVKLGIGEPSAETHGSIPRPAARGLSSGRFLLLVPTSGRSLPLLLVTDDGLSLHLVVVVVPDPPWRCTATGTQSAEFPAWTLSPWIEDLS